MSIFDHILSGFDGNKSNQQPLSIDVLRPHIIGTDSMIKTPYGERIVTYADYTASGRGLEFIENYMMDLQRLYANTHTEDDTTGRTTSALFHQAENSIKKSVGATDDDCVITCGDGATAAIYRLQQILGVAIPPSTFARMKEQMKCAVSNEDYQAIENQMDKTGPVVFVGPFEHHSNEVSWRSSLATVVEIELDDEGNIDLVQLEKELQNDEYKNRLRIGSFSAASNVTGIISPVHKIACLLHKYDALACFDYAASAPYVKINMNPTGYPEGEDPSIDAVYISPHKFLGGPGSSGLLLFKKSIYESSLGPCISGGGTVSYVNKTEEDFFPEIELRERAGTPGILQTLRAALAFSLKDALSTELIEEYENDQLAKAFGRWAKNDKIEILGNQDPSKRVCIISFNIRTNNGSYLHPKFVTALLDDLFGLQTRAGCACAGPYGHRLLNIDQSLSNKYRSLISKGVNGIKPGWCRLGFHYSMDDAETEMIIKAIEFIAEHGECFVAQYNFDPISGLWSHKEAVNINPELSIESAFSLIPAKKKPLSLTERQNLYNSYFDQALSAANKAQCIKTPLDVKLDGEGGELQFFAIARETVIA
ncbi:MAG: aminotransferase class V-fold PLP-dependent enzyme [Kordiimonadaceae bacterium]|jgi:selenocysteine lyase/cysteine desulfurase|nr:aminotransferase class V-fold PLP-dependent enzyme [Kordiimonadaceae bacterium]